MASVSSMDAGRDPGSGMRDPWVRGSGFDVRESERSLRYTTQSAAFDAQHAVRTGARELGVMRRDDNRAAGARELAERGGQIAPAGGIERGGRLGPQQQPRLD